MLTVHRIPVCPFSQRLGTLLALKGRRREVDSCVVDLTKPRPEWLLQKARGTTTLESMQGAGCSPRSDGAQLTAARPEHRLS